MCIRGGICSFCEWVTCNTVEGVLCCALLNTFYQLNIEFPRAQYRRNNNSEQTREIHNCDWACKTRHICTNCTCLENGTVLGHTS